MPTIIADGSQLDQIVINLVVNARDAMPDGGEFVLRTSALHVPEGEASMLVGPDTLSGHYAVLTAYLHDLLARGAVRGPSLGARQGVARIAPRGRARSPHRG